MLDSLKTHFNLFLVEHSRHDAHRFLLKLYLGQWLFSTPMLWLVSAFAWKIALLKASDALFSYINRRGSAKSFSLSVYSLAPVNNGFSLYINIWKSNSHSLQKKRKKNSHSSHLALDNNWMIMPWRLHCRHNSFWRPSFHIFEFVY